MKKQAFLWQGANLTSQNSHQMATVTLLSSDTYGTNHPNVGA